MKNVISIYVRGFSEQHFIAVVGVHEPLAHPVYMVISKLMKAIHRKTCDRDWKMQH